MQTDTWEESSYNQKHTEVDIQQELKKTGKTTKSQPCRGPKNIKFEKS